MQQTFKVLYNIYVVLKRIFLNLGRGRGRGTIKLYLNIDKNEIRKPGLIQQPKNCIFHHTTIFQKSVASIKDDTKRQQDFLSVQNNPKKSTEKGIKNISVTKDSCEVEEELKHLEIDPVPTRKKSKKKEREWDRGKHFDVNTGMWHSRGTEQSNDTYIYI